MPQVFDILRRFGQPRPGRPPINTGSWGGDDMGEDPTNPLPQIVAPGLPPPPPPIVEPAQEEKDPGAGIVDTLTQEAMKRPVEEPEWIGDGAAPPPRQTPAWDRYRELADAPYAPPSSSKMDKIAAIAAGAFGGWQAGSGRGDLGSALQTAGTIGNWRRNRYDEDRRRSLQEAGAAASAENKTIAAENQRVRYEADNQTRRAALDERRAYNAKRAENAARQTDTRAMSVVVRGARDGVIVVRPGERIPPDQQEELNDDKLYKRVENPQTGEATYVPTGRVKIDAVLREESSNLGVKLPEYATRAELQTARDLLRTKSNSEYALGRLDLMAQDLDERAKHWTNQDANDAIRAKASLLSAQTGQTRVNHQIAQSATGVGTGKQYRDQAMTLTRDVTRALQRVPFMTNPQTQLPYDPKEQEALKQQIRDEYDNGMLIVANMHRLARGDRGYGNVAEMKKDGWFNKIVAEGDQPASTPPVAPPARQSPTATSRAPQAAPPPANVVTRKSAGGIVYQAYPIPKK